MEADLELVSTQELIEELMRRRTFMGVVVHSEDEWRGGDWGDERMFQVHFNGNLNKATAGRLLDRVAEHLTIYS